MNKAYIKNYGIHSQYAKNSNALCELLLSKPEISMTAIQRYAKCDIEVMNRNLIMREDRTVMNTISKMAVNALDDLLKKNHPALLSNAVLYSACDSEEHSFDSLRDIVRQEPENVWHNISDLNKLSNPLEMLRLLPTNTLYHVSKILNNHQEGVPLRTASLSGMSALRMAHLDITPGYADTGALVFSSASMLNFDGLTIFGKFNEIRHDENQASGIMPAWGSVFLYLNSDPVGALAELVSVIIHYSPKTRYEKSDWLQLFAEQKEKYGIPEVVVSYDNGIAEQRKAEIEAVEEFFPKIKLINYKALTGYTGKSNNLIDILCCINDHDIAPGARVLLNGAGINYGLGCVFLIKQDVCHEKKLSV